MPAGQRQAHLAQASLLRRPTTSKRRAATPRAGRRARARLRLGRLAVGHDALLDRAEGRLRRRDRPGRRRPRRRTERGWRTSRRRRGCRRGRGSMSRWSASTLVMTATTGVSSRKERSYSSASATRKSPLPRRAFVPRMRTRPPTTIVGSKPGLGQDHSGQRRRRRLSVGAGDRDPLLQAHDLAEHLGPPDHGDARARGPPRPRGSTRRRPRR